ncbi:MAG: metallophosphoesterase [Treponema sp.]|jgi:predicted phosphodiesterase|nr:metallophosphoesterase [Treponema sp.]
MKEIVKFGMCADVHCDLAPDAVDRLRTFIDEMNRVHPDFIIQLGDFCRPREKNRPFVDVWNSFTGPKFHVIGNHDNESSSTEKAGVIKTYSYDEVLGFWGAAIKERYYSFDYKGWHFVVLHGSEEVENDFYKTPDYQAGYRFVKKEQRRWLASDLDTTDFPTILFIHEYPDIDTPGGLKGGFYTRRILEMANEKVGFQKVRAVFTGHHHMDYMNIINGIYYVGINSMSFQWLGADYRTERIPHYSKEDYQKYGNFDCCLPYREPIWGIISILDNGEIRLKGRKTTLIPPTPSDMRLDEFWDLDYAYPVVPWVSDRLIPAP